MTQQELENHRLCNLRARKAGRKNHFNEIDEAYVRLHSMDMSICRMAKSLGRNSKSLSRYVRSLDIEFKNKNKYPAIRRDVLTDELKKSIREDSHLGIVALIKKYHMSHTRLTKLLKEMGIPNQKRSH